MGSVSLILVFCLCLAAVSGAQTAPYKDKNLPVEERVKDLLARMTTEEKIAQLRSESNPEAVKGPLGTTGFGFFTMYRHRSMTPSQLAQQINDYQKLSKESRLGIPLMPYEEALHGLISDGHTSYPQAIAMAATWDPSLVGKVAELVAKDTRAAGIRQVLSPVINVCRDARWGRMEESFGEDTLLTTKMGVAFIKAFEQNGVVTTPKHYVVNVWDGGRDSHSVHISQRQLFDIYMEPFRAAFQEGGARSVMCSYNALNGVPTASDPWLMTEVLRNQWGFKGYVVSDWGAAGNVLGVFHQSATAEGAAALLLNAGMDSEAPGVYLFGKPLENAIAQGLVTQKTLDTSVERVLRVKFELGLFDDPMVDVSKVEPLADSPTTRELARQASRRSMVLLKNDDAVLPLAKTGRIAVFGDLANEKVPLGGYSGNPPGHHSILDGLKAHAGGVQFDFVEGCNHNPEPALPVVPSTALRTPDGKPGLKAEFWPNMKFERGPTITRVDETVDFNWITGSPERGFMENFFSARWTGSLVAPEDGMYTVSLTTDDGGRLYLNDKLVADNWFDHPATTVVAQVSLKAGQGIPIKVEYYENGGDASARLGWQKVTDEDVILSRVKKAAAAADASVVFAGIREGEGGDRAYLHLPGNQEPVIKAAASAGKPVVVVLIAGAPVTMEAWFDRVPAILDAWYPGQEGPAAIAETLFGDYNPGGKLPMTFPITIGQCPLYYNYEASGRSYGYIDNDGKPLFAFGHGLSYSTFAYSNLSIKPGSEKNSFVVSVDVTNSGSRAGDEVVQLYLHQQVASVLRPLKELKGFERITLKAGEKKTVSFTVGFKELSMYDVHLKRIIEPGKFDVMIGSSSADIRASGIIEVAP